MLEEGERVRRAGDYGLTVPPQLPHLERGGEDGGLVFFGTHSSDGKLYEILDQDLNVLADVTMELLIADFEANAAYLAEVNPEMSAAR